MFSEMFIFEECLSDKFLLNIHLNININLIKYTNFLRIYIEYYNNVMESEWN